MQNEEGKLEGYDTHRTRRIRRGWGIKRIAYIYIYNICEWMMECGGRLRKGQTLTTTQDRKLGRVMITDVRERHGI